MDEEDFLDFSVLLDEEDEEDDDYKPHEDAEADDDDEDDEEEDKNETASELDDDTEDHLEETSETDLIARRTRSKYQIAEPVTDTLELPDIEPDLYEQSEHDDFDWSSFCKSLFSDDPMITDDDDDPEEDPEYIAPLHELKEAESLRVHGSHYKETAISKKEVQDLLDELSEAKVPPSALLQESDRCPELFTEESLNLLRNQVCQHVQLLTQTFLSCRERKTLQNDAGLCHNFLHEISILSSRQSLLKAPNLKPAVELINSLKPKELNESVLSNSWRKSPLSSEVKTAIQNNPKIFFCEELLPHCGYWDVSSIDTSKIKFFPSEDGLIAMGLQSFVRSDDPAIHARCLRTIRENFTPCRSEVQIRNHIKNIRRKKKSEASNPIILFYNKQPIPRPIPFSVDHGKTSYVLSNAPDWLRDRIKAGPRRILPSPIKHQANQILRKYIMLSRPNLPRPQSSEPPTPVESKTIVEDEQQLSTEQNVDKSPESSMAETLTDDPLPPRMSDSQPPPLASEPNEGQSNKSCDEEEDDDDELQLKALMAASSTISNAATKMRLKRDSKKDLLQKQKETTTKLLSDDWNAPVEESEARHQALVEHFMSRARDILVKDEDFIQFITFLADFAKCNQTVDDTGLAKKHIRQLFHDLQVFLQRTKAEKLIDDFVLFLSFQEAVICGKTFEYLYWKRFMEFIRKIEKLSTSDPNSANILTRLHKVLSQLKQSEINCEKSRIKTAVHKVLSGHPYLMNEFMSLFLDDKPPAHLLSNQEDYDFLTLTEVDCPGSSQLDFEHSKFSDPLSSLYGTSECPCTQCHSTGAPKTSHCVRCCLVVIDNSFHIMENGKPCPALVEITNANKELTATPTKKLKTDTDTWSIDDDRILLQAVKDKLESQESASFSEMAKQLNKPVEQVSTRFQILIEQLMNDGSLMASPQKASCPNSNV